MACGMRFIRRSNRPVTPASTMRALQAMKAPMAWGRSMPLLAATSAAPGVDQAVSTGWR